MAITTDSAVLFFGTEVKLTDGKTTGTVANNAWSVGNTDIEEWANSDDSPLVAFKLFVDDWSAAPTAGATIDLYVQLMDIESTSNEPTLNDNYAQHYVGSFVVDDADADQYLILGPVALPYYETAQNYQPWLNNQSGVTMGASNDQWDLWVAPITLGPHA